MQAQRRRYRRLLTPALAGLLGLSGAGAGLSLVAGPAAAGPPAAPVVNAPVASADLSITKTLKAGDAYLLTVTNLGPNDVPGQPADQVTIIDTLPAGLSSPNYTATDSVTASPLPLACNTVAQTTTCNLTNGLANGSIALIDVTATGSARITTGAYVTSATSDPILANNTASAPQSPIATGSTTDPGPCAVTVAVPPVRTCNLVAAVGSLLPAATGMPNPIPIWGFAIDDGLGTVTQAGPNPAITMPGPTLVAVQGETLQLVVNNLLPASPNGIDKNLLAVQIPGMTTLHPDDVGIPTLTKTPANSLSYQWPDIQPGTYVYEAGQTTNGARQVAMGLSGLLVVRPANFVAACPVTSLFAAPALACAPVNAAATNPTASTTDPTSSTTSVPTTTAAPTTTTADPGTTAAPTATTAAAAADTTTTAGPTTTADPGTTAAPTTTADPGTTAAPTSTTLSTSNSSTTSTTGAKRGAAALVAAAVPNACTSPTTSSVFTAEAVVQLNELSTQFHNDPFGSFEVPGGGNDVINTLGVNAAGGSSDVATYAPDLFLINGSAYPNTTSVSVSSTDCLAVHYADLGLAEKSLGVLDRRETVMADDSVALAHPQDVATKYLNPGEEVDAVVDMTGALPGQSFPLMDLERHLHNGAGTPNAALSAATGMSLGGQLEILQVPGTPAAAALPTLDQLGLDHSTIADPSGTPVPAQVTLTGHTSSPVTGAEYSIDTVLPSGDAGQVQIPGLAAGPVVIPSQTFKGLANGDHTLWVRVQNANGWSDPPTGVVFTIDEITGNAPVAAESECAPPGNDQGGPVVCNVNLDPVATNGNTPNKTAGVVGAAGDCTPPNDPTPGVPATNCDLTVTATAIPSLSDWNITGFTLSVPDAAWSSGLIPLTAPQPGPVEITGAVPANILTGGLSEGSHKVTVTATEMPIAGGPARTSTGVFLPFTFVKNGPTTQGPSGAPGSELKIDPNPAGAQANSAANLNYFASVRVEGSFTDTNPVMITMGELAFQPGGCNASSTFAPIADGTGAELVPEGGIWNAPPGTTVGWNGEIPSVEFNGIPQGVVCIYAHGKDQTGKWGPWKGSVMTLDKTPPVVVGPAPSVAGNVLTLTAEDPAATPPCFNNIANHPVGCGGAIEQSNVVAVEWQIAYTNVVDAATTNDFTVWLGSPQLPLLPPQNGPVTIPIDISGGPQPYPAGSQVLFRVMDGAGNWNNWTTVNIP